MVRFLLDHNADVNIKTSVRLTANARRPFTSYTQYFCLLAVRLYATPSSGTTGAHPNHQFVAAAPGAAKRDKQRKYCFVRNFYHRVISLFESLTSTLLLSPAARPDSAVDRREARLYFSRRDTESCDGDHSDDHDDHRDRGDVQSAGARDHAGGVHQRQRRRRG